MALIARVSSASTFALFVDTCFLLRLPNCAFLFLHRRRSRCLRRCCCFGSPSLRVHCDYFFSLSTSGLHRIAHLSSAPALFVLPSISSSYQLLVSFSGDYFPFRSLARKLLEKRWLVQSNKQRTNCK
jgi:hypothetical protein